MSRPDDRAPRLLLAAACVALFVAARCVALSADPPRAVGGSSARELFAEPPAKSHEARNYALFGAFKVNPADDYQFWRAQSPAWVYPLAGYFAVFGTDYPQLRTFSTLYAALGLWLLLWIARGLMRPAVWVFVGLLLTLDPIYFHTARVGFLEPAVGSWVALSVLALLRAERDVRWLCVALLAFVLAFFTKQAAIYALPVVGIACAYRVLHAERKPRWTVLGCALLLCVLSAVYIVGTDYLRAVTHNIDHALLGADWPERYQYRGVGSLLDRLLLRERRVHFFASLPISGPLALACFVGFGVRAARRRELPKYRELVLLGWFVCALLSMAVIARSTLRFWTIAVPPAALIAGLGIEHALRALETRRSGAVRWLPLAVPLFGLLAWSARGHALYLGDLHYSVRDGAQRLQQQIGPRAATVVGLNAPGIVLGTPYRNFYLRGPFNSERTRIARLGITHLLLRRDSPDGTRIIINRRFPRLIQKLRPVDTMQVRGETLTLFDVEDRLRAPRPPGARSRRARSR